MGPDDAKDLLTEVNKATAYSTKALNAVRYNKTHKEAVESVKKSLQELEHTAVKRVNFGTLWQLLSGYDGKGANVFQKEEVKQLLATMGMNSTYADLE